LFFLSDRLFHVGSYFSFCFAKKKSSKRKRRFFVNCSADKKIALRCYLKLYLAAWRWFFAYGVLFQALPY
jgi:hypothetical protein